MTSPAAIPEDGAQAHDPSVVRLSGPIGGHKKSKASANYSETGGTAERSCFNCRYFSSASCRLVEGTINPKGASDFWEEVIMMTPTSESPGFYHELCSEDGELTPLIELSEPLGFAGPGKPPVIPEWIPYLPRPGTFQHPKYGSVILTKERNANFVKQFKAGIYQDRLPIDAEHMTKVSGALGYVVDLRQNPDGSVDAKTTWTDRGRKLLAEDRFPYFSPEWWDKWPDPVDGKVHADVAIGGALTTRPFFKPKAGLRAVRPLVASDDSLYLATSGVADLSSVRFSEMQFAVLEREEKGEPVTVPAAAPAAQPAAAAQAAPAAQTPPPGESKETQVTLKPDEVVMTKADQAELTRLREAAQAKTASEATEIQALRQTTETQATALQAATNEIAAMRREQRARTFGDIVDGRDGRAPWPGKREFHIQMMETLFSASEQGMESQAFKDYVEQNSATAEQVAQASKFRDIGSGAAKKINPGSPFTKIELAAKVFTDADPKLSWPDAMTKALEQDPSLYNEYLSWHRETGKGA